MRAAVLASAMNDPGSDPPDPPRSEEPSAPRPPEQTAVDSSAAASSSSAGTSSEAHAEGAKQEGRTRSRFESLFPDLLRRGLERGLEAGIGTWMKGIETSIGKTEAVREAIGEAKLPRELASAVLGSLDDSKNALLRVMAREFREFLEATDIASELRSALTSLSFEIKMEVRFIPNDAADGLRPDIKATTRVKRVERSRRRSSRPKRRRADD